MQRHLGVALALAFAAAACGSSTTAPTAASAPAAAVLSATGALSFTQCTASDGDVVTCQFSGVAQNAGAGCASSVTGQTFSYRPNSSTALDARSWTYAGVVRPSATFTYTGPALTVPTTAGGTYATTFAFTSVPCS